MCVFAPIWRVYIIGAAGVLTLHNIFFFHSQFSIQSTKYGKHFNCAVKNQLTALLNQRRHHLFTKLDEVKLQSLYFFIGVFFVVVF